MGQDAKSGWKLVWAEEFDYAGLPDATKWSYEEGFVRNNEEQYYTRGRLENVRVENGMLVIEARKEEFANPRHEPGAAGPLSRKVLPYTSGSIHTQGKGAWLYGRFEMRAKLPKGKGVWPAFWMLGTNIGNVGWPRCGEIDIMEYVGHTPDAVHGTMHFGTGGGEKHKQSGVKFDTPRPYDDFHVYAVEWFPDRIDCYYDDTKYHTVKVEDVVSLSGENPFDKPHYMILNLALGGGWGGEVDPSILPQKYLVDYIRIYQKF